MFNKIYVNTKNYIKENYKFLLSLIVLYLVLSYPLPYYIYVGGGTIDIEKRIEIDNDIDPTGSLNFAYVKELEGTLSALILAKIIPSWDIEKEEDIKLNEDETQEDINLRNHLYLEEANQQAIIKAYTKAEKEVDIKDKHFYILYIDELEKNSVKVGDEIVKVNGNTINDIDEYTDIVNAKEIGDSINLLVKRDAKEKEVKVTVKDYDGVKLTGLSIITIYEYEVNPEIKLKFKASESGPSGGLMLTLSIYDHLTKEDLAGNKKIVGTGTIESDSSVGEIGGVKYKLKGAVKSKADIFLVPAGDNYNEAIKEKKKHNYDIEIIGVESLDDAIDKLDKLKKK